MSTHNIIRYFGTLPRGIAALFRKQKRVINFDSFEQLREYGPNSCETKLYSAASIKELFHDPTSVGSPASQHTGIFGNPLLTTPDGFHKYWSLCENHCNELVSKITSLPPSTETIRLFDELSNSICLFADCIKFISENHPSKKIAQVSENVSAKAHKYVDQLNTNQSLYQSIKNVLSDSKLFDLLDEESKIVLKSFILHMRLSGIDLDDKTRQDHVNDNIDIAKIGAEFVGLAHKPTLIKCNELPKALQHIPTKGKFGILTGSGVDHLMHDVRELGWTYYYAFDENRENHLVNLLNQRLIMAQRVGYLSYADRELQSTMAGSVDNVLGFLHDLHAELLPCVETELRHLRHSKDGDIRDTQAEPIIYPWCAKFFPTVLRDNFLRDNAKMILDLLTIGNLMEGINVFCEDVLGVSLVPEIPMNGEVWDKTIVKLAVYDENEGLIGFIYCDFFEHEDKKPNTCLHTITCGTTTQLPVAVLQCSFTAPRSSDGFKYPTLTLDQTQTLFHEFGHALHVIFGRTKYQDRSGTRGPTDFSEIPSTLMENFISHPMVYSKVVSPYENFVPENCKYGSNIMFNSPYQAVQTQTDIFHALLDQELHSSSKVISTIDISERLQEMYSCVPVVPGTAWHHRFTHLHHYGARYYSYLWARSISNLVFYNLFYDNPLNEESGRKLKRFLMQGAASDLKTSLNDLVGYEFGTSDMVGAIVEPIKMFNTMYLDTLDISRKWW